MPRIPTDEPVRTPFRILVAMGLVSFSALAYEITLTRIFSFVTWYHFVYLVIGLALLGYGAAGSLLTFRGKTTDGLLAGGAALFSVTGLGAVLGLGYIVFDPASMFKEPLGHILNLAALTLIVFLPFLGAGLVICSILSRHGADASRVYAWDLVGAGLGCAVTPQLLQWVGAPGLAGILSLVLAAGGLLLSTTRPTRVLTSLAAVVPLVYLGALITGGEPEFHMPPTKPMYYLKESGIRVDFKRWSALPRIDVTEAREVSVFGFGGNLSEKYANTNWEIRGVFQDGTAHTALLRLESPDRIPVMDFLGGFIQGSAFSLRPGGSALIIGVGGGIDVLIALHADLDRIVGVEMNPVISYLLTDRYRDFTGGLFEDPRIQIVTAEGRQFLSTTDETFDVIQLSGVDTFAALSSGAYALAEAYVYTVEAVEAFFHQLKPGGILSYSRYYFDPPRETIRNASNMVEALRRRGVTDFHNRILIVAGNEWANCMGKPDGFTSGELESVRTWAAGLGFKVLYDPEQPAATPYDRLIRGGESERRAFLEGYHYDISPATDERPFFFHYFKPSRLFSLEPGRTLEEDWALFIPTALWTLIVSLTIMALFTLLFILGPMALTRRPPDGKKTAPASGPGAARFPVWVYFSGLGMGFLFLEIALMQRFIVFLGNPTYALSVILFTLLASSGLGSAWSRRLASSRVVLLIPPAIVGYLFGLPVAITACLGLSLPLRIVFSMTALAPLGLLLGMAFPLGIRALSALRPGLVPWAFAVNACFTVLASAAAVLVALLFGFAVTFLAAALFYTAASLAFRRFHGGLSRD